MVTERLLSPLLRIGAVCPHDGAAALPPRRREELAPNVVGRAACRCSWQGKARPWHGMAWHVMGMAQHGMAWHGMACTSSRMQAVAQRSLPAMPSMQQLPPGNNTRMQPRSRFAKNGPRMGSPSRPRGRNLGGTTASAGKQGSTRGEQASLTSRLTCLFKQEPEQPGCTAARPAFGVARVAPCCCSIIWSAPTIRHALPAAAHSAPGGMGSRSSWLACRRLRLRCSSTASTNACAMWRMTGGRAPPA